MAFQSIWHYSGLPEEMVNIMERDLLSEFGNRMEDSSLSDNVIDKKIRDSQNAWIPTHHWVAGLIWHYVTKANRENFLYDLTCIDGESLQLTRYTEGQFYTWHHDAGLPSFYKPSNTMGSSLSPVNAEDFINTNCELVRKLSIIVQLSNPDDYEGGNVQLLDDTGKSYILPRARGTVIVFDSRTKHRVLKVRGGVRKSIVGWAIGPRWK